MCHGSTANTCFSVLTSAASFTINGSCLAIAQMGWDCETGAAEEAGFWHQPSLYMQSLSSQGGTEALARQILVIKWLQMGCFTVTQAK